MSHEHDMTEKKAVIGPFDLCLQESNLYDYIKHLFLSPKVPGYETYRMSGASLNELRTFLGVGQTLTPDELEALKKYRAERDAKEAEEKAKAEQLERYSALCAEKCRVTAELHRMQDADATLFQRWLDLPRTK